MRLIGLLLCLIFSYAAPLPCYAEEAGQNFSSSAEVAASSASTLETPHLNYSKEFKNMALNLVLLIAILVAAAWFFKRMTKSRLQMANDASYIKILERRALNAKAAIYVIEVGGKSIVIGESPAGLHTLAELDAQFNSAQHAETTNPKKSILSFAEILKNKIISSSVKS